MWTLTHLKNYTEGNPNNCTNEHGSLMQRIFSFEENRQDFEIGFYDDSQFGPCNGTYFVDAMNISLRIMKVKMKYYSVNN